MAQEAPYGSWGSPVSAADVAATDSHPNWPGFVGGEVWWSERLPHEEGRTTLMRRPGDGGPAVGVLPAPWDVRSRLMEYGGRAWAGTAGPDGPLVVFVHAADQRIHRFDPLTPGASPVPLTPASCGLRFADPVLPAHPFAAEVWCVQEAVGADGTPERALVAVPLDGSAAGDRAAIRLLADGDDFLTGPRISPDGRRVAWIGWNHPAMPWDESRVYTAEVLPDGALGAVRRVAGGPGESVVQVEWTDDGCLYAISDRSGWWNVHRVSLDGRESVNVCVREEEFGGAPTKLGLTWCAPLPGGRLAVLHGTHSTALSVLDPASGELRTLDCPYTEWAPLLAADGDRLVAVGASPDRGYTALLVDTVAGTHERLSAPRAAVDTAFLPVPQGRTFPGPDGRPVHAVVLPPRNPGFTGPPGERPPYVVLAHSGPTGRFPTALDLEAAFFTSRGIGVVGVDYSGSTGYGRAYRDRLRHAWGVADVADCAAVARALVAEGAADGERLAIRGASAGGWTAAVSLVALDLYCCAALHYPVLDPVTWRESQTGGFEAFYLDTLIGRWPQEKDRYLERSPARGADRVDVPFLLLQGSADPVCPPEQAEAFLSGVRADAAPYRHLVFDGERHGFKRSTTIIECMEAELAMYAQAFGVAGEPAEEELVHGLVRAQARRSPGRPAVRDAAGTWTYRQLVARAERLADLLHRAGVRRGDRVGIHLGRSRDLVAAVLAVLDLGCAYVPLDPEYPADRLGFMARDAGPAALLTRRHGTPPPAGNHRTVYVDEDDGTAGTVRERVVCAPGDAAYVIYTSGSTGTPKGAVLPHRGVANILRHARDAFGFTADDTVLALAPFSFDFAQLEMLLPLVGGGTVQLADRAVARDPELLDRELAAGGATFVMGTPSMFGALTSFGWRPPERLRIVSGGEVLPRGTAEALSPAAALWNIYGPTETLIFSVWDEVRPHDVTIGRPVPHTVVEILRDGERCADGETGEICIGGHGLAIGYHGRPELTAARFVADPFRPGERLYRTGDLARRRPDGRIVFEGRADEQVKIRGHRIELGEVEDRLVRHEGVRAAAVVAEPGHHSLRLAAYVVLADGADTAPLRPYLARFLPAYAAPHRITAVASIPLGPNGKTDRRALTELTIRHTERADGLAGVWRDVLGTGPVAASDNFFALGGDSLSAMEVAIRARDLGIRVRPADLYGTSTFGELSDLLATRSAVDADPAHRPSAAAGRPQVLSPAQHRFLEWDYKDGDHYNVSLLLDVDDTVDRRALEAALTLLADRHPALRLRLGGSADAPEPYTDDRSPVPLSWHTLPEGPACERAFREEADRVQRSLSLRDGPVWRAVFFTGAAGHRLLLVLHHFVADGMSLKNVARDLASLYAGTVSGSRRAPVPVPSWAEHAATLGRFVNGPLGETFQRWWCELPWDALRPLPADHRDGSMHLSRIRSFTTGPDVPPGTGSLALEELLLSALTAALAEASGSRAAAVDVCRHGRTDPTGSTGFSGTVGWLNSIAPYVLALPVQGSDADVRDALHDQITRIRAVEQTWGALRHLHDGEEVRRRIAALPPAEVYLNFLGPHMHDLALTAPFHAAEGDVGTEMTPERTQPYRIKLYAETASGRLLLRWHYSRDVHEEAGVRRIAEACERWMSRLAR